MKVLIILAAAAFAVAAAGKPHAQPNPAPPPKPLGTLALIADANHDGKVSLKEYQDQRRQMIMMEDKDRDGRVSRVEWNQGATRLKQELRLDGMDGAGRFNIDEWWAKLDRDHDGYISPGEIDMMTAQRFKLFDTNLNGFVDGREPQLAKLAIEGGAAPP